MQEQLYKKPFIFGVLVAAIIHSIAILTRELSPTPIFPTVIDALAFNGSWVYLASIAFFTILNINKVKTLFTCIPERVGSKTIEGQKLVLAYEFIILAILLFAFPAVTYFYTQVEGYFAAQHPEWHRFIEYMPFTDLINRAMTSFPFFITLFTLVSLLCVIMPHTYLAYKCVTKAKNPLQSAIIFSLLLSTGITASILGLLAMSVAPWMLILLVITGPVILLSFIIVNVVMLRYHNKYIVCDQPENA